MRDLKLIGKSFHSVRGGVGRSTLAMNAAIQAAQDNIAPVYLIDVDVCSTSMVDDKPLLAPRWTQQKSITMTTLHSIVPDAFWSVTESKSRIDSRKKTDLSVTFVNEWFFFETPNWDEETDVLLSTLCWKLKDGPPNLRIVPHSPLPADVKRIQTLLNDEEHGAFMEGRLEYLLCAILKEHPTQAPVVVIDSPCGLYGLGRSVVSLGLRLSSTPKKTPLAEDGFMPWPLCDAKVDWTVNMVHGNDFQDIKCLERWLKTDGSSDDCIRMVSNARTCHK